MPCEPVPGYFIAGNGETRLTQDLCYLCGNIIQHCGNKVFDTIASPRIQAWWKCHQANDEKRVRGVLREYYKAMPRRTATQAASMLKAKAEAVHPVSDFHITWFKILAHSVLAEIKAAESAAEQKKATIAAVREKLTEDERKALGL